MVPGLPGVGDGRTRLRFPRKFPRDPQNKNQAATELRTRKPSHCYPLERTIATLRRISEKKKTKNKNKKKKQKTARGRRRR